MTRRRRSRKSFQGSPETRERIVDSARALFESHGYAATTIKDIAHDADITRELVYYYFSSKEDILDEVIDAYVDEAIDSVKLWSERLDGPGAFEDHVAAFRRFLYSADGTIRPMHRLLGETDRRSAVIGRAIEGSASFLSQPCFDYLDPHADGFGSREMFKFVLFGVLGLLEFDPDLDDDRISALTRFAMHIDDDL